MGKRPPHVDKASWNAIMRLQDTIDAFSDPIATAAASEEECTQRTRDEEFAASLMYSDLNIKAPPFPNKKRHVVPKSRKDQEAEDLALALQLATQHDTEDISLPGQRPRKNTKRDPFEEESIALALKLTDNEQFDMQQRLRPKTKEEVLAGLDRCQQKAIKCVDKKVKALHESAIPELEKRIKQTLELERSALDSCLSYIREEAPIIIHIKPATLSLLLKDTHYRNLFETKTSGGSKNESKRASWEDRLFGKAYSGSKAFQRPKYGCLNVTGDIRGVPVAAKNYGELYMVLNTDVRYRCTFSDQDSSRSASLVSTHEYYAHVLNQYNDAELKAVLQLSRHGGGRSRCVMYKEVQIHGPVNLETDIQALSLPGKPETASKSLKAEAEAFQKKTGCNIFWQDDLLGL